MEVGGAKDTIATSSLPLAELPDATQQSSTSLGVFGPHSAKLHVDSASQPEEAPTGIYGQP